LRGQSILRNTVLLTLTNLALRSVSLLFQVYLAGAIGAVGMGKMQLVLTAGGFAMTLGISGSRVAAMNLTAEACGRNNPGERKAVILRCLLYGALTSSLAGALLLGLSRPLAVRFVRDLRVIPALQLTALSLPVNCLVAVLSGYFTARGRIRRLVEIEILERALTMLATVLLLKYWAAGQLQRICCSIIGGSTLATAVSLALLGALLWRELRCVSGRYAKPVLPRLLRLCLPLAFSDYLRSGLSTLEQFLIPRGLRRHGLHGDAALGNYGTISGMVFPVLMFPAALFYSLSDLLVPELSRCRVQGRRIRIRTVTARCLRLGLVFSAMVAGLTFVIAPALGQLLYGSRDAGRYLRIFAPMILLLYPDALTDGMLKGLGEQLASVRYNTLTAAADVVFLFCLLPIWGIGGFIFTFAVTHALNFALSLGRLIRVTGYRPDLQHLGKTAAVAVISVTLGLRLAPAAPLLPSLLLSAGVFLCLFFLLCRWIGVFRFRELRQYMPKKKKAPAAKRQQAR